MPGLFDADLMTAAEAATVLRHGADVGDLTPRYAQAVLVLLDERDANRTALRTAVDMRQAQKAYFRSKSGLPECKDLERKLDQLLKE